MELDQICRLCLSNRDIECSLYVDMDEPGSLCDNVKKCVDIKIINYYGWPYLICQQCIVAVKSASEFRNMVTLSDSRLRSYVKKLVPELYPTDAEEVDGPLSSSSVLINEQEFAMLLSLKSNRIKKSNEDISEELPNRNINFKQTDSRVITDDTSGQTWKRSIKIKPNDSNASPSDQIISPITAGITNEFKLTTNDTYVSSIHCGENFHSNDFGTGVTSPICVSENLSNLDEERWQQALTNHIQTLLRTDTDSHEHDMPKVIDVPQITSSDTTISYETSNQTTALGRPISANVASDANNTLNGLKLNISSPNPCPDVAVANNSEMEPKSTSVGPHAWNNVFNEDNCMSNIQISHYGSLNGSYSESVSLEKRKLGYVNEDSTDMLFSRKKKNANFQLTHLTVNILIFRLENL